MKKILITGSNGFIGSAVVRGYLQDENNKVVALDGIKYSGCREHNEELKYNPRFCFEEVDLVDKIATWNVFYRHGGFDLVIHMAAESSVDKSIKSYESFVKSNVLGTCNLLDVAKEFKTKLFINTITDEVYGHLHEDDDAFTEATPIQPRNIYSASKAAQFHFGMAWLHTFEFPVISIMPANNYGPRQLPEKLLPRVIYLLETNQEIPVYGTGANIRTWLYVEDTVEAIKTIENHGIIGRQYNIGSGVEMTNLQLIEKVADVMGKKANIKFVEDRKGHDFRYSICDDELRKIGFQNKVSFEEGLKKTIQWNLENFKWLEEKNKKLWGK